MKAVNWIDRGIVILMVVCLLAPDMNAMASFPPGGRWMAPARSSAPMNVSALTPEPAFYRSARRTVFLQFVHRFSVLWGLVSGPAEKRRFALVEFLHKYNPEGFTLTGEEENLIPWLDLLARHLRLYVLLLPFSPNFWATVYFLTAGAGMMWEWAQPLQQISRIAIWFTPVGPLSHFLTTLLFGWGKLRITPVERLGLAVLSGPGEFAILAVALGLSRKEPRASGYLIDAVAGFLAEGKSEEEAHHHRQRTTRRIDRFVIGPGNVITTAMSGIVLGIAINLLFPRWGWWVIVPSLLSYANAVTPLPYHRFSSLTRRMS